MRIFLLFLAALAMASTVSADIITYDTFGEFQGATSLVFHDDFESYPTGKSGTTLGTQGITFTQLEAGTLDVSPANLIENLTQCATTCLTADGNEDFRIQLTSGDTFAAIGFDFLTNQYDAPQITLTGVSGQIATFFLNQPKNSLGFIGIVSDVPILSLRIASVYGQFEDSAMDNVSVGAAGPAAAPEPALGFLAGAGMLGLCALTRNRRSRC